MLPYPPEGTMVEFVCRRCGQERSEPFVLSWTRLACASCKEKRRLAEAATRKAKEREAKLREKSELVPVAEVDPVVAFTLADGRRASRAPLIGPGIAAMVDGSREVVWLPPETAVRLVA